MTVPEVLAVNLSFIRPLVLKGPHLTNRILFRSSGPTNAIIEEADIPEELPRRKEHKQDGEDEGNVDGEDNVSDFSSITARKE